MNLINLGNKIVNNYLYTIEGGYVLIDTGYEKNYRNFTKKLKKYSIEPNEILYVFLTHAHDDHAGFLNALLRDCERAKVVLSEKALTSLRNGQNNFDGGCSGLLALLFCKLMAIKGRQEHRFPSIRKAYESRLLLIENMDKKLLEQALCGKIMRTPGHTSCSISLLHNDGALFCGDAAMNNFPSIYRIIIWVENKVDFRRSWKKMIEAHPKMIYPAHGQPFLVADIKKFLPKTLKIKSLKLKKNLQ